MLVPALYPLRFNSFTVGSVRAVNLTPGRHVQYFDLRTVRNLARGVFILGHQDAVDGDDDERKAEIESFQHLLHRHPFLPFDLKLVVHTDHGRLSKASRKVWSEHLNHLGEINA